MLAHVVFELLKGLVRLIENLPDSPHLGRKLLLGGGILFCAFLVREKPEEWADAIFIVKVLSEIAGSVCTFLGALIFFRRWVWKRQEKRPPAITVAVEMNGYV